MSKVVSPLHQFAGRGHDIYTPVLPPLANHWATWTRASVAAEAETRVMDGVF